MVRSLLGKWLRPWPDHPRPLLASRRIENLRLRLAVVLLLGTAASVVIATASITSLADTMRVLTVNRSSAAAEAIWEAYWITTGAIAIVGLTLLVVAIRLLQPIELLLKTCERLRRGKAQAERTADAKSLFLAQVSHELRTPMTSIVGFSDILRDVDSDTPAGREAVTAICRNARHLCELINNVLDLSKIEAGEMSVDPVCCDLPEIIAQTVALAGPMVKEKGLEFRVSIEGLIPQTIHTDALRVRQILMNLISNARKFTQRGSVELRVRCKPAITEAGRSVIEFAVTDTGIGMTPQQMSTLFQPFKQADRATERTFGGTGLGLSICKSLARLLGGSITVASTPSAGSTFTVSIDAGMLGNTPMVGYVPKAEGGDSQLDREPQIWLGGKILLVEDSADSQRLISLHLRRAGALVITADDGEGAIERLESESFDLILMDLQMPRMDGFAALSAIRERGYGMPVIALTAGATESDRRRCDEAGFTDYLTKPIERQPLLQAIRRHLPDGLSPEVPETLSSPLADDPELADLLASFVKLLPEKVERLHDLLDRQDVDQLRELAHQIKGAAGGYGFPELTARAGQLEAQLRASTPLDEVAFSVSELMSMIRKVKGYPGDPEVGAR